MNKKIIPLALTGMLGIAAAGSALALDPCGSAISDTKFTLNSVAKPSGTTTAEVATIPIADQTTPKAFLHLSCSPTPQLSLQNIRGSADNPFSTTKTQDYKAGHKATTNVVPASCSDHTTPISKLGCKDPAATFTPKHTVTTKAKDPVSPVMSMTYLQQPPVINKQVFFGPDGTSNLTQYCGYDSKDDKHGFRYAIITIIGKDANDLTADKTVQCYVDLSTANNPGFSYNWYTDQMKEVRLIYRDSNVPQ